MTKKVKIMVKNRSKKGVFLGRQLPPLFIFRGHGGAIFFEILVFVQMWSLDEIYRNSYFLESVPRIFVWMDMEFSRILAGDLGQKKTEKIEKMRDFD